MPTRRELDNSAILSGLNMDTFRSGFDAQAKKQQAEQKHALDLQSQAEALKRAKDMSDQLGGKRSVAVTTEGASLGGEPGITPGQEGALEEQRANRALREQNAKEGRLQKYTHESGVNYGTANALRNLEEYTAAQPYNKDGGVLSSDTAKLETRSGLAGLLGKVPVIGQPAVKAFYPQESSKIQAVLNTVMKEDIGLTQTLSESERQIIGNAQSPTASHEAVVEGLRLLQRKNAERSQQTLSMLPEGERQSAFDRGAFDPSKFTIKKHEPKPKGPGLESIGIGAKGSAPAAAQGALTAAETAELAQLRQKRMGK